MSVKELGDRIWVALAEDERVVAAVLFGSRAKGAARPDSDVDIALLLTPEGVRERRYLLLRSVFQRLGEQLAVDQVDLVVLNEAPPGLAFRVVRDGHVAGCKDQIAYQRFVARTYQRHADFAPTARFFAEAIRNRLAGYQVG